MPQRAPPESAGLLCPGIGLMSDPAQKRGGGLEGALVLKEGTEYEGHRA